MAKPTSVATTITIIYGLVSTAFAGGSCGGFDLANHGQARQCLTDSGSPNGCYNRYGVSNSCWRRTSQSRCCNHGVCSGIYDRYNSHCTCNVGWKGKRCDQSLSPAPSPPAPSRRGNCPSHAHKTSRGCACDSGYKVNSARNGCVRGHSSSCPANAHKHGSGCACDSGYKVNSARTGCVSSHGISVAPPARQCPSGERECGKQSGCGWCIASNWNSKCVPGDDMGRMDLKKPKRGDPRDCKRGYTAGHFRPYGSMCVTVVSDRDVRCYKDCQYGNMENFIVPDKRTCMSYDTAFKSKTVPFHTRTAVYEHVASHLISHALSTINAKRNTCTRGKMKEAFEYLERKGLAKAEEAACDAFTSGVGAYFCHKAMTSKFAGFVNNKVSPPTQWHSPSTKASRCDEFA